MKVTYTSLTIACVAGLLSACATGPAGYYSNGYYDGAYNTPSYYQSGAGIYGVGIASYGYPYGAGVISPYSGYYGYPAPVVVVRSYRSAHRYHHYQHHSHHGQPSPRHMRPPTVSPTPVPHRGVAPEHTAGGYSHHGAGHGAGHRPALHRRNVKTP